MKERPIIFSAPMVRALLDGTKTQTRRAIRPQPVDECGQPIGELRCGLYHPTVVRRGEEEPGPETFGAYTTDGEWAARCPYGAPGDRLWVREAHWFFEDEHDPLTGYFPPKQTVEDVEYRADVDQQWRPWRSPIHMPRWASRITLEVTDVRVERLQEISEAEAIAEGVDRFPGCRQNDDAAAFNRIGPVDNDSFPIARYAVLWEEINGPGGWEANPWVWAVSFKRN